MQPCKPAPSPQGAVLFDFITTKYQGPIRSLHIFHLKFGLVFLGSSVNMLPPNRTQRVAVQQEYSELQGRKFRRENSTIEKNTTIHIRVTL